MTISVSVLMPAYNAEKYIGEAIESILNQTFRDFEFIIIDDCSTDKTWEIIQEYAKKDSRIVASRNDKNLKISAALNKGIDIAHGKYIARMDADDWSYPDRLQKQFDFMQANPDIGVSGGTMEVCDEKLVMKGYRKYKLTDLEIRKKIFRYSPFCHAAVMYRYSIDERYNSSLDYAEDYDLYFRIGKKFSFGNLDEILIKVRRIEAGISISQVRIQEKRTIYIRLKAIMEYGYKINKLDFIYLIMQYVSIYIIPSNIKIWLFSYIRDLKK
ncbi:MAG: glycosyltransferase family 2 protein [Candidatus Taylorbacteria bacterium]|nr:glycosyltransferase family 2 protein [Candidatus Taylorbacteria bacterium]